MQEEQVVRAVLSALGFPGTALEHSPGARPSRLLLALPGHRSLPLLPSHRAASAVEFEHRSLMLLSQSAGSWWCPQSLQQKGWAREDGRPFSLNSGWVLLHPSRPFPLGWQEILSFWSDLSKGNYMKCLVFCTLRHSRLHLKTPGILPLSILRFPIHQTLMLQFQFLKKHQVIPLHCPVCALLL